MPGNALPPARRSATALGLLLGVASGRLLLQRCAECTTVQYPPREACVRCLGDDLPWTEVQAGGEVLARTMVRASNEEFFRQRQPWPIGIVAADCGPRIIAHLEGGLDVGERVALVPTADAGGRPVLVAVAARAGTTGPGQGNAQGTEAGEGADSLAVFRNDVAGRTVLVTDAASRLGGAVVEALRARGAGLIVSGDPATGAPAIDGPADLVLDTRE